jgi:hypothetical protein
MFCVYQVRQVPADWFISTKAEIIPDSFYHSVRQLQVVLLIVPATENSSRFLPVAQNG